MSTASSNDARPQARKDVHGCARALAHACPPAQCLNSLWPPCASQVLGNVLLDQEARDANHPKAAGVYLDVVEAD
eukprot:CAMPEP_0204533884 /NCGR_PEP_ID=MMETSP0661-20131031/12550_1 /ASSEMBLY_ACC=CAM_ASM_000606 /TAXON_ID=109239 /ORGANISM="Alexandrium margalefi, Strain AMGDE01CS-322" /LENGTH=74 /DNA_ID=CAMNT_0051540289 /DNA_START=105 /DNA_END=326 /DNA_ORIENTATION=+